jgi:hypothetical protein
MLLNMFRCWSLATVALALLLGWAGCMNLQEALAEEKAAAFGSLQGLKSGQPVTQEALQAELLRFESQFSAGVEDASRALESSPNMDVRYIAMRNRLNYASNSLEIATGASPETDLLDLVTLVELSKGALESYWIPKVFGASGKSLDDQFRRSEQQIWNIVGKVLNSEQQQKLRGYLIRWKQIHPNQVYVESVRLSAFAFAGGLQPSEQDDVGGLFASVEKATQTADEARLFAARALYYAERAPMLMRLQAKVGSREILYEIGTSLEQAKGPALQQMSGIGEAIEKAEDRFLFKLGGVGAVLIVFFWGMALLSKVLYLSVSRRHEMREIEKETRQKYRDAA